MSDEEEYEASDAEQSDLEPAMINEILLICSNLGLLHFENEQELTVIRGEDCEEWIHDLQRVIRRDSEKNRLVAIQLGKYKLVQKKLLPLFINHQHDWKLVFSILKVLVMLTMKPSVDSLNISQQIQFLREYKHAILTQEAVPLFITILMEPLAREQSKTTPQDYLNMELILMLLRNLLAIPDGPVGSGFHRLQGDLIKALHQAHAYETIHLFAKEINTAHYREWNLLLMEIIDLTLSYTHPVLLWKHHQETQLNGSTDTESQNLMLALQKEKREFRGRHSNFGGLIKIPTCTQKQSVLTSLSMRDTPIVQIRKKAKGTRNRKHSKNVLDYYRCKDQNLARDSVALDNVYVLCDALLADSYYQLMTSLKSDFRRGSSKILPTDRLMYFHLVWFLTSFQRQRVQYKRMQTANQESVRNISENAVLATLDMFSFNFVLKSIENYLSVRERHGADQSVKLLSEKMAYLHELLLSQDSRIQRVATSIQHKLYHERDFLDRIPSLTKEWQNALDSIDYGTDIITLHDIVFQSLEAHERIRVRTRKATNADDEKESAPIRESDFDVKRYFLRILSSDTIQMYARILANYRNNTYEVNQSIYAYFYRVYHFTIENGARQTTTRSMLFHIQVLAVFQIFLQDTEFRSNPRYQHFVTLIHEILRAFFTLAKQNSLLFVECLLRQSDVSNACLNMEENYAFMSKTEIRTETKERLETDHIKEQTSVSNVSEEDVQSRKVQKKEMEVEADGETEWKDFHTEKATTLRKRLRRNQNAVSSSSEKDNSFSPSQHRSLSRPTNSFTKRPSS